VPCGSYHRGIKGTPLGGVLAEIEKRGGRGVSLTTILRRTTWGRAARSKQKYSDDQAQKGGKGKKQKS